MPTDLEELREHEYVVPPQYTWAGHGLSVVYPSRQQRLLAVTAFADMAVEKLTHQDCVPASSA